MKFSIVTVVYNSVSTIERTIRSVKAQNFNDFEYIVVDGGSTDGTLDILRKHASDIDVLISEKDNGIYDAMNKACKLVHGDWVFFINGDDVFYNDNVLLSVCKKIVAKNTLYYGGVLMEPISIKHDGEFNKKRLCQANICHQSIFYPKKVFDKYQYNTMYRLFADWDLNIRCMGDSDFNFCYLNELIAVFNIEGASRTRDDRLFRKEFYDIIRSAFGFRYFLYLYYLKVKMAARIVYYRIMKPHVQLDTWTVY